MLTLFYLSSLNLSKQEKAGLFFKEYIVLYEKKYPKTKGGNMNKEVTVLTKEHFMALYATLIEIGFEKIVSKGSNLVPPRDTVGTETSFIYTSKNGYSVIVHTTYLEKEDKWRDVATDNGWVLIAEHGKEKYFCRPFKRTSEEFIFKILRYAWVTKWKVDHRPLCPVCGSMMEIFYESSPRACFWICRKIKFHKDHKPEMLRWDHGLPEHAQEFVDIRRNYTARYTAKNAQSGVTPTPAPVIRKPWKKS